MKKTHSVLLLGAIFAATSLRAENWMARLPDKAFVSTLSIPGTHDTATGSGWVGSYASLGDAYARTQDLDIAGQWAAGIRAFDLRPSAFTDHLNLNHGIMATVLHFDQVLCQLRDSLIANPSEFVIIHIRHESEGDQTGGDFNTQMTQVLKRSDLKPYLANFKTYLRVSDMRGKILILSRSEYASAPVGGFIRNWTSDANWSRQTQGTIVGPLGAKGTLYMQDYYETCTAEAMQTKINAINQMLDFSTTHKTLTIAQIVWVLNFASAYSQVINLLGNEISTSDGYRDNAAHTHEAILDYLSTHEAGPTGIVLMDYAGVDVSTTYAVRGLELVNAIIANNFRYMEEQTDCVVPLRCDAPTEVYSLQGVRMPTLQKGTIQIVRDADGRVRKVLR